MTDIILWEKLKEIDAKLSFLIDALQQAEEKAKGNKPEVKPR